MKRKIAVSVPIPNNSTVSTFNIVYGYEEGDPTRKVEMRLTGVLSKFNTARPLRNLKSTSDIKVKNLGRYVANPNINKSYEEVFFNSWIYYFWIVYIITQDRRVRYF